MSIETPVASNGLHPGAPTLPAPLGSPQANRPIGQSIARPGKRPDYRLRGLDLGEPATETADVRPKLKNSYRRRRRARRLVQILALFLVAAGFVLLLRGTVLQPYSVNSDSMAPTLVRGDRILVLKPSVLTGGLKIGDMVVFRQPLDVRCQGRGNIVQRIVAVGGQTIWTADRALFVNGKRLDEKQWFWSESSPTGPGLIDRTTVPEGHYFVLGDNRPASCDSRTLGSIPKSAVVGKVVAVMIRSGHFHLRFY